MTPLDQAHAAITDDVSRARFYSVLASAELFLLLKSEAMGEMIEPDIFETDDGTFVLAFDREDGLAEFVGKPAPYVAMSGRALINMIHGQGIGIALNPAVAPSAQLIDATAVAWLHETLKNAPTEVESHLTDVTPPSEVPDQLLTALDAKLAGLAGQAVMAYLVGTLEKGGARGHLLAFIGAKDAAQQALAQAVAEAMTFSGLEAGALDVAFFDPSDPMAARLANFGLRFDLPQLNRPTGPGAPGMDPSTPPKLR